MKDGRNRKYKGCCRRNTSKIQEKTKVAAKEIQIRNTGNTKVAVKETQIR